MILILELGYPPLNSLFYQQSLIPFFIDIIINHVIKILFILKIVCKQFYKYLQFIQINNWVRQSLIYFSPQTIHQQIVENVFLLAYFSFQFLLFIIIISMNRFVKTASIDQQKKDLPVFFIKTISSFKDLKHAVSNDQSTKKIIHRKPNGVVSSRNSSKNKNSSKQHSIPRYLLNTSNFKTVQQTQNIKNSKSQKDEIFQFDLKTQKRDIKNQKLLQNNGKQKKYDNDSADYYKYWKKKAHDYQQLNFSLHSLNSSLQQQNQVLKHKLQRMQKKNVISLEPQPIKSNDQSKNYQKLQNYYRTKVDQMSKIIQQQKLLINKLQKKIKDLSKSTSQNSQLKNLLNNMEQKFSQMRSMGGSKEYSRADQMQLLQQKEQIKKTYNQFLQLNYDQPHVINKNFYGIKNHKKMDTQSFAESRSISGRQY